MNQMSRLGFISMLRTLLEDSEVSGNATLFSHLNPRKDYYVQYF